MPLHLTKVAFGCRTIDAVVKRVAARTHAGEMRVVTRMRPKRMEELIGGSLHWIVKHRLIARQRILRFDDRRDGRIDIVCSAELEAIVPVPKTRSRDNGLWHQPSRSREPEERQEAHRVRDHRHEHA